MLAVAAVSASAAIVAGITGLYFSGKANAFNRWQIIPRDTVDLARLGKKHGSCAKGFIEGALSTKSDAIETMGKQPAVAKREVYVLRAASTLMDALGVRTDIVVS